MSHAAAQQTEARACFDALPQSLTCFAALLQHMFVLITIAFYLQHVLSVWINPAAAHFVGVFVRVCESSW